MGELMAVRSDLLFLWNLKEQLRKRLLWTQKLKKKKEEEAEVS
jgi:hypothetical protein